MGWIRHVLWFLFAVLVIGFAIWAGGALFYDLPLPVPIRRMIGIFWWAGVLALAGLFRPFRWAVALLGLGSCGVLGWWLTLEPQQERDWKPEVATLAHAKLDGDWITIDKVRHFHYRTETDFTPRYETRRYRLSRLRGLDLFLTYWGSPAIAHPIFSFDFGEDGRLAFSLETRPVKGQEYSAIAGFFRQFELICIPADERDVIGVRAIYRKGEEVYLYPLRLNPEQLRIRLLDYLLLLNRLAETPEWYNALTNNCTSSLRTQGAKTDELPWDWRLVLNGFGDELLYERGIIEHKLPFPELKARSHINERARQATDADFSWAVRQGLP